MSGYENVREIDYANPLPLNQTPPLNNSYSVVRFVFVSLCFIEIQWRKLFRCIQKDE